MEAFVMVYYRSPGGDFHECEYDGCVVLYSLMSPAGGYRSSPKYV